MTAEAIKCVVWDLDGTLWREVAVELPPGARPRVLPAAARAVRLLAQRGIVNSIASRTDPAVARHVEEDPDLAGRFVAGQLSWGHKSDAIMRIAGELGIDPAAMAFVDDDPFERAEVAAMLPQVRVLAPAQLYAQLDTPPFRPAVVTDDARHRVARYRDEARRRAAAAGFAGDREQFLRGCRMRLAVRPARAGDLDRLTELVARTHRFSSTGTPWTRARLGELVADPGWLVPVARLSDRFGDYGTVGTSLLEWAGPVPRLHLFTVSCRAAGRGVPAALLRWLVARAQAGGAARLLMDLAPQPANLELRVLLRAAGFQAAPATPAAVGAAGEAAGEVGAAGEGGPGLLERPLAGPLPAPVGWLELVEEAPDA